MPNYDVWLYQESRRRVRVSAPTQAEAEEKAMHAGLLAGEIEDEDQYVVRVRKVKP